jgi:type VI secretion system protein ImpA
MASEAIIELDGMLGPISEDNPVGDDIREDSSGTSPYNLIKDARNAARSAERKNMFEASNSEADDKWREVMDLASDILQNQAKDLDVASWYTESLIRHHGFRGLRDGFKLIQGLLEQYWDNLYPMPDEDGLETRVASLTGLNGEGAEGVLIPPIRNVDITEGSEPGPFNFWKYQQALDVEKVIEDEAKAEKAAKVGFSVDDVDRAVTESSDSFFIDLRDDISDALSTYRDISRILDEKCGANDSPPTSNIINALEECLGTINHIAKYKFPADESPEESEEDSSTSTSPSSGSAAVASGPVKSREQAFKSLTEISEFFRKTEPHSPISYILARAVKWGDMPLDSLIRELIPESSARDFYSSLTGVKIDDDNY